MLPNIKPKKHIKLSYNDYELNTFDYTKKYYMIKEHAVIIIFF